MMFKYIILVFATFINLNFTEAIVDSPPTGNSVSDEVSNSIYFSLKSYQTVFNGNENFVFSPFSLRVIYNILFQVAFGHAETELEPILFENYGISNRGISHKDSVLCGQRKNLRAISRSPNVKIANKLYYPKKRGLQLTGEIRAATRQFKSENERVNFGQRQATIENINNWVKNRTNGMIQNIVDSSIITPDTLLLFVNTVYFKAKWLKSYDEYNKRPYNFNSIDGTTKSIDFIRDQSYYQLAFINELNVDVLELPYQQDSGFVFWILLPQGDSSIVQLKTTLSKSLFTTINNSLGRQYSNIKFPMFEIESEMDGKSIANDLFTHANFQVFNNRNSTVGKIKQKSKIIVNLDGTEAASATVLSFVRTSAMITPSSVNFIADRPFIYTVLHKDTLQPIFIGHFTIA